MLHNQPHYFKHTPDSHQWMYSSEKVLGHLCCLSGTRPINTKDLSKREAILNRLVTNIPGALYQATSDRNWTMEFISPAIFQITGYPASDFINNRVRSFASIIHPEDKKTIALILEENLAQKSSYHLKYRIQREEGVWIWVSEKGQGIFDEEGNLICLNGIIFEPRDRGESYTKATQLSTRLNSILETISDFVSISDATGRFLYINRAGRKLVGLREDEDIRNLRIGDFCTSKALEIILREGLPKAEENGQWRGETELLPRKGEAIPVSQVIMAHKSMTGEVEMFSSIVLDLREHLEIEKALRLSETKNRNLLTAIPDVIFQLNEKGILLESRRHPSCNFLDPHFSSFLEEGISPNDILGKSIEALFPQELAQWMRHYLELTLKTGEPQSGEYLWQVKSADIGTVIHWNHYEARYIPSGNNEILVMVRDITARKRLEAELRIAQVKERDRSLQLEKTLNTLQKTQSQLIQAEKMSGLGRVVAGISHEINNPINFISGNIDYAKTAMTDILKLVEAYQKYHPNTCEEIEDLSECIDLQFIQEDLPKLLSSMKMGVHRIQEIVRATRNFSRMDESEKKFVNLHEGLESTLQILQYRLKSSTGKPGIQLIKNYGELPKIECYAGLINQVFMNILDNGIEALETLKNNTKTPTIVITTELLEKQVIIKIADNGSGITPEVQKHIFDPFFTTKPVGKGTGLGLAISYAIVVEKHQGSLQCFSTPEEGTEFIIVLPLFHP
jgi:two-component system, NtrC family, sensor kinase